MWKKSNQEFRFRLSFFLYVITRIGLRLFLGKKRRKEFFERNKIRISYFFPNNGLILEKNGIKAHARKNNDDYDLLFVPRELELVPHLSLNYEECFIDVGANVGYYTLKISREFPQNKIISIEAHPNTFKELSKREKITVGHIATAKTFLILTKQNSQ